jgi:hypothetical protein
VTPGTPDTGSGRPVALKLGITESMVVALLGAPADAEQLLGPLPPGVTIAKTLRRGGAVDLIVCFCTSRRDLERRLDSLLDALDDDGVLWVAWPKRASGVPTDLSDQVVRTIVLPTGWVDTKVCAIDATWSGLKFLLRTERRGRARAQTA